MAILFPACALATYLIFAKIVNHTEFALTNRSLHVRHGPFPWPGSCRILLTEIECLIAKPDSTSLRGPYRIEAILKSPAVSPLLTHVARCVAYGYTPGSRCSKTLYLLRDITKTQADFIESIIRSTLKDVHRQFGAN